MLGWLLDLCLYFWIKLSAFCLVDGTFSDLAPLAGSTAMDFVLVQGKMSERSCFNGPLFLLCQVLVVADFLWL